LAKSGSGGVLHDSISENLALNEVSDELVLVEPKERKEVMPSESNHFAGVNAAPF